MPKCSVCLKEKPIFRKERIGNMLKQPMFRELEADRKMTLIKLGCFFYCEDCYKSIFEKTKTSTEQALSKGKKLEWGQKEFEEIAKERINEN